MNQIATQSKLISRPPLGRNTNSLASPKFTARAKYLPLLIFQLYLTGSLVAFAFGPLEWEVDRPFLLYSYVILGQISIAVGYYLGISRPPQGYNGSFSTLTLLKATIVITLVLLPPTLAARNHANLSVTEAIADPGTAYESKFDNDVSNPLLSIPRTLLSPILGLSVPLGIVYWRRMSSNWRLLWAAGICGRVVLAIYTGRAFGIFDIMLVVPWMLWLFLNNSNAGTRVKRGFEPRQSKAIRRKVCAGAVAIVVVVLAFWYFTYSREARLGGYPAGTTGWSDDLYGVEIPESAEFGIYYVTWYWTLGYYGLSGCQELPFEWTRGVGHSSYLMHYLSKFNRSLEWIESSTYPARLEATTGYSSTCYWHTIYAWLASDLTFPGALLFIGLMGFLLARAWSDSLVGANPFALGFLGQIMLLFYYIPANNLRMANPEASFALWGLLIMWTLTKEKLPLSVCRI